MKRDVGVELDPHELASISGAGWLENNWFFGYSDSCSRGANSAHAIAFEQNALARESEGLPFDAGSAFSAGNAASDDFFATDPRCQ